MRAARSPGEHPRAGTTIVRKLLLLTIPLCLVVLGAEILLRTTHLFNARVAFTEPDATIGYRFTPGSKYWFMGENDHPIQGRINSMGWRDHERARRKPDGFFRVAVLGDSFVEAFQVELDSTLVAIAQRRLNEHAGTRRVECQNFGRSGMTTTEEYLVLERDVLPCDPDAVVLLFTANNDIADVNPATADHLLRPFPRRMPDGSVRIDSAFATTGAFRARARVNGIKQRSALASLIAERYNTWRRSDGPVREKAVAARVPPHLSLCTATPDPVFAANYSLNKMLVSAMAGMCRERGVAFYLMSVPPVSGAGALADLQAIDPSFDPVFYDRDLATLADSIGAGFVPLTARFLEADRDGHGPLFWAHWNYAGHRLAGARLAAALATAPEGGPPR